MMSMNAYKKGIIKHPHSEGKSGKVYIGDTLKASIETFNEQNPQNAMPPIECSGKTYSYRLLAAAGKELESSELLHRFYGRRSFHEIEMIMSTKKYEFQQEIRRICQSLAEKFPHVLATADLWAAHEALKSKLCNRKAEQKREMRKRDAASSGSTEPSSKIRRQQEVAARKAANLVQARRQKAESRKRAETRNEKDGVLSDERIARSGEASAQPPVSRARRDAVENFGAPPNVESETQSSEEEITARPPTRKDLHPLSDDDHPPAEEEAMTKGITSARSLMPEDEDEYETYVVESDSARRQNKESEKQRHTATDADNIAHNSTPVVFKSREKRQAQTTKKSAGSKRKYRGPKTDAHEEQNQGGKRRNRSMPKRYRE